MTINNLKWEHCPGTHNCAPLELAGHYVISHRPGKFTIAYRPPGQHYIVGTSKTLDGAKYQAEQHYGTLMTEEERVKLAKLILWKHDSGSANVDSDSYRLAQSVVRPLKVL